ncbi:bestrophin family ion channel [Pseudoxanthomonas sp.]|uniref:bestrophin family protein n=1 Tax=Pseudoxanthomonas sp. TaxID=1871049 RepID=UPI0026341FC5|nr:bestrophin family ion channel [Pseudoxanthomonas sp.]WDS36978.1 MAG: bestrophin family ion channel [Pseudoxanthomonas sp.]
MHTGHSYRISEFVFWTRRSLYALVVLSIIPVLLYQMAGYRWLAIPWGVVLMLGTTVALMAGFKNTQTYNRTWEAQRVWASIAAMSRLWGAMSRDYVPDAEEGRRLVYRHLAWLTALRYQMRDSKAWETLQQAPNVEYRKHYSFPEKESTLEDELSKYVAPQERSQILVSQAKAAHVLSLQSEALKAMLAAGGIPASFFVELQKILREFQDLQAKSEQIKNYPYPRQYAIVNTIFVRILCLLLPLGMINELEPLNRLVDGFMAGRMVWLAIPLSALICWMYAALDQVGESSANPFEGGANDVPISQICVSLEVELRQLLGEFDVPEHAGPSSPIVL